MATTRGKRLVVVGLGLIALIALMYVNVNPEVQYTVDEIMDSPEDYTSEEINLRGTVLEGSWDEESKVFILKGTEAELFVDFSTISLLDGFGEGYMVAVQGELEIMDG